MNTAKKETYMPRKPIRYEYWTTLLCIAYGKLSTLNSIKHSFYFLSLFFFLSHSHSLCPIDGTNLNSTDRRRKKPEMFHINMPSFRHCQLNITIPNKQNTATEQDSFVKKRRKIYIRISEHNFYRRYFNIVYSYQRRNTRKRKKKDFLVFFTEKNDFELINQI